VKYNKNCFLFILFSHTRVQVRPVDGFLRTIAQKTWNHARICLFGVIKIKFNDKPLFIPQNIKIWPKMAWKLYLYLISTRGRLTLCLSEKFCECRTPEIKRIENSLPIISCSVISTSLGYIWLVIEKAVVI